MQQASVGWFLRWLVGEYLFLKNVGSRGIIFMALCVFMIVAMAMLLRDFGNYEI
jgi:hypothetical protein